MLEDAAKILSRPGRQRTRDLRPFPRAEVMGVPLDACSAEQFVATVEGWVDDGDRQFAAPVNAHLVNLANRDPELAPEADPAVSDSGAHAVPDCVNVPQRSPANSAPATS